MRIDATPIQDPRNAVGMLTDVFDLVITGPVWRSYAADNGSVPSTKSGQNANVPRHAVMEACAKIGREFSKMPRHFMNGYKRRGGSSALYQRLLKIEEDLPQDPHWLIRDNTRRVAYTTVQALGQRILSIAIDALTDEKRWQKFIRETHVPARPYLGTAASINPPEWLKAWHDFVSGAIELGIDPSAIAAVECNWRFRDLTDRSHRGRNVRAAWEAAWLSGNYKFATQLIESIL